MSESLLLAAILTLAAEPAPCVDLSGKWCHGNWVSCTSGHKGPLGATFCKVSDNCYRVQFHGRFFVVVPFRYTVHLEVTGQDGDRVFLSGSSYLGPIFGTFQYTVVATSCDFQAEYTSKSDCGRFTLCR